MQKDSMHLSTSGHITHSQAVTQEPPTKSFQCSHCPLIFKSKVYLFEHLNKVHDFDVDAALRDAGLKPPTTNKANTDNNSNSAGNTFECQHCDFKAGSQDFLNEHEKQCPKKSENQNMIGNLIISENPETKITVISTKQQKAAAEDISSVLSVMSTSKTKCTVTSKDLKTYKRPLQAITEYFSAPSGSNGKPPVKLADGSMFLDNTKGTLILQESPSSSSPNSSGVFKVTAKPTIDITKCVTDRFLLKDHLLITNLKPPKSKELVSETVPNNIGKRTNNERSKSHPAKKAKSNKEETKLPETANASEQQSSGNTEFSFEVSEDEEEKKIKLVDGDTESPKVYFCKHCDYSDVIRRVSTHYQNNHPYVRYNAAYIQDPNDQSATFRCLECPVEFPSVADLKRHYTENHPEAPNVFTMQSRELSLVFKCFVCPFTTNAVKALKEHYKEKHSTHKVDNSLMYCRYLATRCQEGPSQLNTCEKAPSPETPGWISLESPCTPCKEIKNAPSPQHPTTKGADVALYHCNNCNFSHKSVVVMHVHYQKTHPDEVITIDKIKQSACVTSQMKSQKSPNSVTVIEKSTPQKNISDSSKKTRNKAQLSQQKKISSFLINTNHTTEASKTHSESAETKKVESAEDTSQVRKSTSQRDKEMPTGMGSLSCSSPNTLFYCQFCSYSSTNIKSVVSHNNIKHAVHGLTGVEEILRSSTEVQKKKLQSEAEASASTSPSDSKTSKQVEVCSEKEAADTVVTKLNAYACPENLFYCQKCNYGNLTVKGVMTHQARVHQNLPFSRERIVEYTALIRDEIEKSKSQAKESSFPTHLPLPLMNEGDEHLFFCHFCNYRQSTVDQVLRHYFKRHRGFVVKGEQVRLYTTMVLKETQKSHLKSTANQEINHASLGEEGNENKKTKKLGKVSASPSTRDSQTQRTLQCYRCPYNTQYVYLLKRHIWKIHRAKRSVTDILRVCFRQGALQAGYHCDLCVFAHKKATVVYKHYQEHHPGRRPSLEYVTARLYVGPETSLLKRKKRQIKHTGDISDGDGTDGSLPSQRSGQNETKMYSCRACSFKGCSMSSIIRHYHAVHPWSVKEDGSVLDVINSKKPSANRQVEDHNEMTVSFDTYQVPLEFDNSPGSSLEATASSTMLKCSYCPASFHTQRGLNTHRGMKHQEAVDETQEQQEQIQTRMHVFKCPHCTYVNTNYQGVLTHCQMKHPTLAYRADSLHVDKAYLRNSEDCLKRKGPGLKLCGYMCITCPRICATSEKLNKHCEQEHETVANTVPNMLKPAPKPSAVSKIKQSKTHSNRGSVSKASFLSKKIYSVIRCQHCAYSCSTKIALGRHLHVCHKIASVLKVQDCIYKCVLCSSSYLRKKRLGSHYIKKHGKEAFLKYFAPVYKQAHEKPAPKSPYHPLTQQPENTSEACKSSTMTGEYKILVYMCPSCPYVNASYHGTLTHCQMRHPDLVARADELQTREVLVTNMVRCTMGKSSNERGYMCKKCPQIHVSLKKLKIHCERDHRRAEATASEHSAEIETERQPDHGSQGSLLEAFSKTSAVSKADNGFSPQLGTLEMSQSNTQSVQNEESLYKCHICTYTGWRRRYLHSHYKKTHKLDAFTTYKLLEKYNKRNRNKASNLPEAESEESAPIKCKMCPNLMFNSSQLLIAHYRTFHSSDRILDFIVLSQGSKKTTGLYKCALCKKQMNGIRKLCYHLDRHREREKEREKAEKTKASLVITTTPVAKSSDLLRQDELPMYETVEELAQWNVTPVETFTLPPSPQSSPSKPTDLEQPELESREDKHNCKQCRRRFMSLKGLRSHERSHAAVAAMKKRDNLPTSALKHKINKYVLYKTGTMRPFLCSFCSFRTTAMGLLRSHFTKRHKDVIMDAAETGNQDEESAHMADEEPPNSSEEFNNLLELDEKPEITEESLYLEPPDVQRQLNHYSLMAQAGARSKASAQETKLPENSLLHCEVCNFTTGHLRSMRRHYLNRHGKKILRCKDCNFFTGLRKTLEMHMEAGHPSCQSEPTHQKDLRCPFCLYQTKNKNNMIDHVVLHREERVVPIEVRRPKLSRYLQGIVFRCHKCTFSSGSADNLRLHMMRHDDIKPYKCRLCYFDCTRLSDLEAHLSDKHQVMRNHELVGQVSLDQLEARVGGMPEGEAEPLSNLEHRNNDSEDVKTEEFVMDCNEVRHETQAKNLAENNIKEKTTLQIKETYRKEGPDGKNVNEDSPYLQYENAKLKATVQEKHEQDPQEQAGIVFSPDTARGQGIENIVEQNVGEGNNADIQFEDCNGPEKERQTNENKAQPKLKDSEGGSITFTRQKEEAAEGSSTTYGKIAEKAQAHKLHIKALQHRTNIEAKVEDDILRHILLLDEDGSIRKMRKRADQDRTVKMEQNIEPEIVDNVVNEIRLLDKEGSIALTHSRKNLVNTEAISASAKKDHAQAKDIRAEESFRAERHLLSLTPNCGQLKISHKEILGVSLTNCKKEQVHNLRKCEEVTDSYGEMPVLENEYLKEEMHPLGCCKEEDQNDHLQQKQEKEDEMITEDDENRCTDQEHEDRDGIKEADNPHVPKGALTVTDGAAAVLCPAATKEKLFTCEFCGRNLTNSSELERHVVRHGI
ncbi:zinc finger protein 462-like [Enoplosus armatus]|uniref:zinc finger protein 462-like n=1 Tax=Enoplosus armatus TaxID=215367 RepID=UPI0039945912